MTALEKTQAVEAIQKVALESKSLSINNYIDWFDKINLNTLLWQIIALIVLFYFGKEIKLLIKGIVSKIPHIKSMVGIEFGLSDKTKAAVEHIPDRLLKEIQEYEIIADKDPNIVFLTIFVDIEGKIRDICTNYYINDDLAWLRASPNELIQGLVRNEVLDKKALPVFQDVRALRNRIAHGEKPFANLAEAKPYFEAIILLRDIVQNGLTKVMQEKKG